jgi:sulfur carrier protein ThiS
MLLHFHTTVVDLRKEEEYSKLTKKRNSIIEGKALIHNLSFIKQIKWQDTQVQNQKLHVVS